jgi:hypothetical protein
MFGEGGNESATVGGEKTEMYLNPGLFQTFDAAAGDQRIRIEGPDDDPGYAGGNQGIGTRPGTAGVGTGFEGYVKNGSLRGRSGGAQREDFSVGLPGPRVKTLTNDDPVTDQNGTDRRVGTGPPLPLPGEFQGTGHVTLGWHRYWLGNGVGGARNIR